MLCATCQHICIDWSFLEPSSVGWDGFWGWLTHHPTPHSLRSSAEDDLCYICTRLWKTVQAHQDQTTEPSATWAGFLQLKPGSIPSFSKSTRPETKDVEEDIDTPFSKCRARYEIDTEVSLHFQLFINGKYEDIDRFSILSSYGTSRKSGQC